MRSIYPLCLFSFFFLFCKRTKRTNEQHGSLGHCRSFGEGWRCVHPCLVHSSPLSPIHNYCETGLLLNIDFCTAHHHKTTTHTSQAQFYRAALKVSYKHNENNSSKLRSRSCVVQVLLHEHPALDSVVLPVLPQLIQLHATFNRVTISLSLFLSFSLSLSCTSRAWEI